MKPGKTRKIIIGLLAVSAVALLAAGCGEITREDFIEENELTAQVTYLPNGGTFGGMAQSLTLYYKANSPIINLGITETTVTQTTAVERTDYIFQDWYFAELDEETGLPIFESAPASAAAETGDGGNEMPAPTEMAGAVVLKDKKVDFSVRIQEGEHWYIAAAWAKDVVLEYRLGENCEPITVSDETAEGGTRVIEPGGLLKEEKFGRQNEISLNKSSTPLSSTDSTYVGELYSDAACTVVSGGQVPKPTDGVNAVVYARYIPGKWTIVKDAQSVRSMFSGLGLAANRYYVLSDIDCAGESFGVVSTVRATVEGNGCTISNITVTRGGIGNGDIMSLFGKIEEEASIHDLTFRDLTVNYTSKAMAGNLITVYGLAERVSADASLENFRIDGFTMTLTMAKDVVVSNIQKTGEGYQTGNWLFGNVAADSEVGNITVTKKKLVFSIGQEETVLVDETGE